MPYRIYSGEDDAEYRSALAAAAENALVLNFASGSGNLVYHDPSCSHVGGGGRDPPNGGSWTNDSKVIGSSLRELREGAEKICGRPVGRLRPCCHYSP